MRHEGQSSNRPTRWTVDTDQTPRPLQVEAAEESFTKTVGCHATAPVLDHEIATRCCLSMAMRNGATGFKGAEQTNGPHLTARILETEIGAPST